MSQAHEPQVNVETLEYHSSVDEAGPLLADVGVVADGVRKPLLLVMHGYSNGRDAVRVDIEDFARQGVVAVAPDMRGLGESWGMWDSGGLDVHDIVDAGRAAIASLPDEIDATNWHIIGYSGGGANAIAAGCRFPDLFQTAVSFFGFPCYRRWLADNGRPDCVERMERVLGTAGDEPLVYDARDMVAAAENAGRTRWHFLWDAQEKQCPPDQVELWIARHREACGQSASVQTHVSGLGDSKRWIHNYRKFNPALPAADKLFWPDFISPVRDVGLYDAGELVVPGYLVTRHFSVFVGDSASARVEGRVRIRYRLESGKTPVVEIVDNPSGLPVDVRLTSVIREYFQ